MEYTATAAPMDSDIEILFLLSKCWVRTLYKRHLDSSYRKSPCHVLECCSGHFKRLEEAEKNDITCGQVTKVSMSILKFCICNFLMGGGNGRSLGSHPANG